MFKLRIAKELVQTHKTKLTVVATALPLIAIHLKQVEKMNEFLDEHNLLNEFYDHDEI